MVRYDASRLTETLGPDICDFDVKDAVMYPHKLQAALDLQTAESCSTWPRNSIASQDSQQFAECSLT